MKKTFQKTLIAAAAGVALMSAVGTASANSLLFPYFTTSTKAQSILSLSAAANGTALGAGPGSFAAPAIRLHYVYNYGPTCVHYDANGGMTPNDILSHSIAATTAGGVGKVVGTDASTPVYFPLADQTGFLVVTNTTGGAATLRGSMAIVDTESGLVVSYPGIDNALDTTVAGNEGNFSAITDRNFVLTSMPSALVTTNWFGVSVGDMNGVITTGNNWRGAFFMSNGGFVWNNDEVPYSGETSTAFVCQGTFSAAQLMTSAQNAAVGTNGSRVNANGAPIAPTAVNGYTASTGAVMLKMQRV